ncbi:type 1 fimbrial protein [Pseudomonas sp. S75]|uniref:fimbrial protein n=1 Tax=unclassified Pseudomonas TaxID=196821 RepID=UPI0019048691|nr:MULTISPECIES: fimbrial protein [unclassified Pseudomonas]MBJ9976666.1 type 1 fimbrial protein [Pseudomonas sp. S30]MBK0153668.1 type 1 fimbrial protein [Pseudomonas sp. S75]
MFHPRACLTLSLLALAMSTTAAQASDGKITFNGSITDAACAIAMGSEDLTVNLPQVTAHALPKKNAKAGSTPFQIKLDDCSVETLKNATITFNGRPDDSDETLLHLSGAKGVALQLGYEDGSLLKLNTASTAMKLNKFSNAFDLTAAYVRTAADATQGTNANDANFTVGAVSGVADFTINYK